jgi:hypothetical protein
MTKKSITKIIVYIAIAALLFTSLAPLLATRY